MSFINFCLDHWEIIFSCLMILLSVLMALFKKKPVKVVDTLTQAIISVLPEYINFAEQKYGLGNGDKKKAFVIDLIKAWAQINHFELDDYYLDIASNFIELILSTPHKKED